MGSYMDFIYNNFKTKSDKLKEKGQINELKRLMEKKQNKVLKYWRSQRNPSRNLKKKSYYDKLYSLFPAQPQRNHYRFARMLKSCRTKKCVKQVARKLNYMQWLY